MLVHIRPNILSDGLDKNFFVFCPLILVPRKLKTLAALASGLNLAMSEFRMKLNSAVVFYVGQLCENGDSK